MAKSASKPISVVQLPYERNVKTFPAPMDDWGYYEGRPTPALSPLMPYNTVPWFHRKWMFDKLQTPIYSTDQKYGVGKIQEVRSKFVSANPINKPSTIKDFHLIAIRKQVEQLFAPNFAAHLIVKVNDTMNIPPCFWVRHGRFQKSWWIGDGTGGEILTAGHEHWLRDGSPSGMLKATMQLSIASDTYSNWGGSIKGIRDGDDFRSSYGNFYIIEVRYEWEVEEYWRKMVLEDWSTIRSDYMSIAPNFLMPHWGSWAMILQTGQSPTGKAIAFAIDTGQMWQVRFHPDGSPAFTEGENPSVTQYLTGDGLAAYTGPHYTACTRPYKEGPVNASSAGGSERLAGAVSWSGEFKPIEGFNCGILDHDMIEVLPPPKPEFPPDLTRPGKTIREDGTIGSIYKSSDNKFQQANSIATIKYRRVGEELEITPNELRLTGSHAGASYTHVAHCKGAKIQPKCYVTIMDLNGRVFRNILVKDVEMYME